jgi:hypothetical protein
LAYLKPTTTIIYIFFSNCSIVTSRLEKVNSFLKQIDFIINFEKLRPILNKNVISTKKIVPKFKSKAQFSTQKIISIFTLSYYFQHKKTSFGVFPLRDFLGLLFNLSSIV